MPRTEPLPSPLPQDHPVAVDLVRAIQEGQVADLQQLLAEHPELATAGIQDPKGFQRTPLHIATDWPGHFPQVVATIQALISAGADPNARVEGGNSAETPLHWGASSNDVAAIAALLDAGADIEANGAIIGGGTAMADAVAFRCWEAAEALLARGANTTLLQASGLGSMDRVQAYFQEDRDPPEKELVTKALWYACHGGRLEAAKFLAEQGADLNWLGWDHKTPLDAAKSSSEELVEWLRGQGARSVKELF